MRARSGVKRGFSRLSDRLGGSPFPAGPLSQTFLAINGQQAVAPEGALFAFIEVQGQGGGTTTGNGLRSAGGAANDAIIAVTAGDTMTADLPYSGTGGATASISLNGSIVISAQGAARSTSGTQTGPSGKYPGNSASSTLGPGRGGGRLAGEVGPEVSGGSCGHGSGRVGDVNINTGGGRPVGHVAFFRAYDDALAFANSLYGGNWQP